jgi:Protein of unknown function (DUF3102)
MRKAKKTKAPRRKTTALDRITARLRTALRHKTENTILIGNILIEAREELQHGDWQSYLSENFDLSYRTAVRYVDAAEYVTRKSKSDTVADFANLAPTVLYRLAAGHQYNEQEEAAILAATRERRIDDDAATAICEELAPQPADDDADHQEGDGEGGGDDEIAAILDAAEAEDAEIAAILDGPPPPVPPPAPIPPPPDFALRDFDQAISKLKRLMTKLPAQFASSSHSADDLEQVECFIRAVTLARRQ